MSKGAEVYSLTEGVTSPMVDSEAFTKQAYKWVKNHVHANEKVGLAVSGGTDSSVAARILRDSVGENLYLMHMDHGFMRLIDGNKESDIVAQMFSDYPNFTCRSDVKDRFYGAVRGIEDGNEKRAAFRKVYTEVLSETMEPLKCIWTSDGTIKPDIRETKGGIKLQHNVDLPFVQNKLEPLAALSKQEVRALAKYLGIPHLRQPFPGPGLLIRTVGTYSPEKLKVEKKANDIVEHEYKNYMLKRYGAEMLIDEKTGLQRPFQTLAATFDYKGLASFTKGMLTKLGIIKFPKLKAKVTGVIDEEGKYERIYKRPSLMMLWSPEYISLLYFIFNPEQRYDDKFSRVIEKIGSHRVLYHVEEKKYGDFAVAIRAVDSVDVKIAFPNFGPPIQWAASRIINEIPEVSTVFYDITPKPPATVEYE